MNNLDKIENIKIIPLKTPEKAVEKVEKLPKDITAESSVKNVVPQYHFNANLDSGVIKESQHSISTIQKHEIKTAQLTQYCFQPNQIFFFNWWIGVVLLLFLILFSKP